MYPIGAQIIQSKLNTFNVEDNVANSGVKTRNHIDVALNVISNIYSNICVHWQEYVAPGSKFYKTKFIALLHGITNFGIAHDTPGYSACNLTNQDISMLSGQNKRGSFIFCG
jgi:hypothetical protein